MANAINIIIAAGHSALDVAIYTLLPIMVVMTILLRLLEVYGILGWIVRGLSPLTRPFGLTGLGGLAVLQTTLISFIAPLPTLKMMERKGVSDRHLAAALGAVFASATANAAYPLSVFGLDIGMTILLSVLGALVAAATTYNIFGRKLSSTELLPEEEAPSAQTRPGLMTVINESGGQAVQSIGNIIPMLLVSLVVVFALQAAGAVDWMVATFGPVLQAAGGDSAYILPTLTKVLAGGSAMVAVFQHMANEPNFDPMMILRGSGILINPLDLPGIGIFAAAGPRLARVMMPAIAGGMAAILVRSIAASWLW